MKEVSFEAGAQQLLAKADNVLLVGKQRPSTKGIYEEVSIWNLAPSYAVILEVGFEFAEGDAPITTFDRVAPNESLTCFSATLYDRWSGLLAPDKLDAFLRARKGDDGYKPLDMVIAVLSEGHVHRLKWKTLMEPRSNRWFFQGDPLPLK